MELSSKILAAGKEEWFFFDDFKRVQLEVGDVCTQTAPVDGNVEFETLLNVFENEAVSPHSKHKVIGSGSRVMVGQRLK
jgi:hypothetical protein